MKKQLGIGFGVAAALALIAAPNAHAQQDYMPPMSGWPTGVQTQWQVQGEYYGSQTQDTTKHLGAWVVANGGSSYGLVILPGGLLTLPGQPYGGWDTKTLYQGTGTSGPVNGTLNGKVFNVSTATGGFVSDSITGNGEARSLYVHNGGTAYVLQRVKRHSPTLGLKYSAIANIPGGSGVVSLFDSATGQADLSKWATNNNDGGTGTSGPILRNNYLYRGVHSVSAFGRVFMHIEFFSCFNPTATGQGRANSGVYQQGRYETQVLDNFGLPAINVDTYGAIYSIKDPPFDPELPPQVTLQTYDIYFSPRTSGGENDVAGSAYFTVYANGVLVQDSTLATHTTTSPYNQMGTDNQPVFLQNHGNEVVFNNIWVVPNATVTSLPYSSILAAALPPTSVMNPFSIKRPNNKSALKLLGIGDGFDLTGRHIHRDGAELSILPVFILPKKSN